VSHTLLDFGTAHKYRPFGTLSLVLLCVLLPGELGCICEHELMHAAVL
jgi:hypothetical protein